MDSRAVAGEAPRIAVLFGILQSGNRANGGVESVTQVIEHLDRAHRVVVTQRSTPMNERWQSAGADVRVWRYGRKRKLPVLGRVLQVLDLVRTNYRAYRLVRRHGISVVHCNDLRSLWQLAWGARAAGASVVFNIRDVKAPGDPYGVQWTAVWLATTVVCLSREMKGELDRRLPSRPGGRAIPVRFIYSIVDFDGMRPLPRASRLQLRKRLGIEEDEFAIGYVAAFNRKKAQLRLIQEALPRLQERLPTARVYFIGDFLPQQNAYARRCKESAERFGLQDMCRFVGYTEAVDEWYQAIDLNLVASVREGLARGMIESIACGTPVVSYDVCSAKEILEGFECGEVVPQGASDRLIAACTAMLRDQGRIARYSRNGVSAARKLFDRYVIIQEYESLYEELSPPSGSSGARSKARRSRIGG